MQARRDLGRFYYDTALSTSTPQLSALLEFADASKIVFGSDFPYAAQSVIDGELAQYAKFVETRENGSKITPEKLRENSLNLSNKHSNGRVFS